jgi:hypothetical protein
MKRSLLDLRENADALLDVAERELVVEIVAFAGILRAFVQTEHAAAIEDAFVRLAVAVERGALLSGAEISLAPSPPANAPRARKARTPRAATPRKKSPKKK